MNTLNVNPKTDINLNKTFALKSKIQDKFSECQAGKKNILGFCGTTVVNMSTDKR